MSIAALMLTAGVFLVMAGIRDESVPAIIADVIGGKSSPGAATPAPVANPLLPGPVVGNTP